ncbi:DUF4286 family protein [Pedobacter sp.]|uniref:DUF4286 family protein n=1 Tax=Pedobacter sp. TaxID=1411316 RepID=UPI003D7F1FEB
MFLYNITQIVEDTVLDQYLEWMEKVHLPQVMATGKFVSHRSWRIIDSPNEGTTYSNQFFFEEIAAYADFQQSFEPTFQQEIKDKFGDSVLTFTSLMQDEL